MLLALPLLVRTAASQNLLPLEPGVATVTCFSGYVTVNSDIIIAPNDYVLGLIDIRTPPIAMLGRSWTPPMYHHPSWTGRNLGQIFGLALDDNGNIYVTATSMYGLPNNIMAPGVFGPGGSGGVYKIDGRTGTISVFARLPNSRPGLGNICFDSLNQQFFVSNFEDGKIYRLNMNGVVLSTFDPRNPDNRINGIVNFGERVWGVGIRNNTLYYSIWREDWNDLPDVTPNEIWSIRLNNSGAFLPNSERREFQVPIYPTRRARGRTAAVSDISFAPDGRMILAEVTLFYDIGATEYFARLLEYQALPNGWSGPKTIYVGNSRNNTNTQGGVDYGYDNNQRPAPSTAYRSIWATGNPLINDNVANGGIIGIPATGNTKANVSTTSFYIDVDGIEEKDGYVKALLGDIEIFKRFQYRAIYDTLIICDGEETTLNGGTGIAWKWSTTGGLSCNDCQRPTVSPSTTTDYFVETSITSIVTQPRYIHVIVKPTTRIHGRLELRTPYLFGDTVIGAIILDDTVGFAALGSLDVEVLYRSSTMLPLDRTPATVAQYVVGTLMENWNVGSVTDNGTGTLRISCTRTPGAGGIDSDTLARIRFATTLFIDPRIPSDSVADITLPCLLTSPGIDPECTVIEAEPGHLQLELPDEHDTVSICSGESVQLDGGDGIAWDWTPQTGLSCDNCRAPIASPTSTTTYRVDTWLAPKLKRSTFIQVNVTPPTQIIVRATTSKPLYQFGDRVEVALVLDDPTELTGTTGFACNLSYRNQTMAPIGATPDSLRVESAGTLLENWNIDVCEDNGSGTVSIVCTPLNIPSTLSTDTLLRLRFATYTAVDPAVSPDSATTISLPLLFTLTNPECHIITEEPGLFRLFLPTEYDTLQVCENESIRLDGGEGVAWRWDDASTLDCRDCRNPIASPGRATTYHVETSELPGVVRERFYHVVVNPPRVIRAHIGEYGPFTFGDTVIIGIMLDDSIKASTLYRVKATFFYEKLGMRPTTNSFERFESGLKGTLLENWQVDELYDDYQGTFVVSLIPPAPLSAYPVRDTGTLMYARFATYLGLDPSIVLDSIGKISLPFELELFEPYCTTIAETPGRLQLGICGLHHRLIQMTSSKYSIITPQSQITDLGHLQFSLGLDGPTRLELFDVQGNQVATLINDYLEPGEYDFRWDASSLPSGLYFYRLSSGDWETVEKVIVER